VISSKKSRPNDAEKIDNVSINTDASGHETMKCWRVYFSDGKEPWLGIFKDETELQFVSRPHSTSEGPGFYPDRLIMG
jgi:hypothetical protein